MQGRSHLLPFENEPGVCLLHPPAASIGSYARIIPAVAEARALRAEVTYEDPTGSFSTGGGATPAGGHTAPANGLDWTDDADTNVLQPRHLPRSLITDSELDWDEHDEGSTELWNGPGELLRGERRAAADASHRSSMRQSAAENGNRNGASAAQRGPRLPEPTLTPKQARALQPTAAEPGRGALKPGAVAGQGRGPQAGAQNRGRRGTLPPPQLGAAEPDRQRRGTLPPAQLGAPQVGATNGQRRGTLPPAQLGVTQVGATNGQRHGTLPPAQLGASPQTAVPNGHAAAPGAPRTPPPPRRNTPVPSAGLSAAEAAAAAAAAVLHGMDPAILGLDPRRQSTLVMHAPPRPQMPPARPASPPAPRVPLPAAAHDEDEDALEQLQEQLFEAMARARADAARAERAELRAQQAESRLEGLDNRAQRAEAELSGSAERVQQAELQAQRAEGRARSGESRAQQAEQRSRQLDAHLQQLEAHVHQLRARTQHAEELAHGASERIREAETRAQQATARLLEVESRVDEATERAQDAEERAQEAEAQLENMAMAQASSQPLHEDAHSAPAVQQLREQVALAYEHIRVSEVRADDAERRAQAAEQAARIAQSSLHLSEDTEHRRPKKPSKLGLVQSALLASTLSFGVGAYFALFVPLQKRVQSETELRTQEAAQHAQAISTLQAQRDADARGLTAQNQELRSQLEAARVEILTMGDGGDKHSSRRERVRAADAAAADSSEPEAVPGTRSAKAIERRLRRQRARTSQADAAEAGASEKPAPRSAAPSRRDGNDPLDGL